jgi:uncharacterized protein YkwD
MLRKFVAVLCMGLSVSAAGATRGAATERLEEQVLQETNAIREQRGLAPLEPMPELARAARQHSQQMAQQNFLGHTDPSGRTLLDRINAAGITYRRIGENVAMNAGTGEPASVAVRGWLDSKPHRENLLDPRFTHTGIGVWSIGDRYYFTQLFLTPPQQASASAAAAGESTWPHSC